MISTVNDVGKFIYSSFVAASRYNADKRKDEQRRNPRFTKELIKMMGSPDENGTNIIITGSKGKGALSVIINSILMELGYSVGLFTGPHLVNFNERIMVDSKMIADEDFIRLTRDVEPAAEKILSGLAEGEYIGPIGILAVVAMLYFNERKTDFNIIECGKGARYDDVAQLKSDISIINSIFLEHTGELGATIEEIAYHKAGIVRAEQKGVFLGMQPYDEPHEIVLREAAACGTKFFAYGKDYAADEISVSAKTTSFSFNGRRLETSLCGEHQAYNAATAIAAVEFLIGKEIDKEVLSKSLLNLRWKGRLDVISENPLIILDGCINRMSAGYIKNYLESINKKPDIIALSVPDDKDSEGVIETLKPLVRRVILTKANNPALKYSKNLQYINAARILGEENISFIETSNEAIGYAVSETKEMLCVLGTISFIRDAVIFFEKEGMF